MPVVAAETYNPGPTYTWIYKFSPDYTPTTTLVRDGTGSLHDNARRPSRRVSQLSLHLHTSGHIHPIAHLSQMQATNSPQEQRSPPEGTTRKHRTSKSAQYTVQAHERSSHSAGSSSTTSLPPGARSPSTKPSSRSSQSSSLPSSSASSTQQSRSTHSAALPDAGRRSYSSQSASRVSDTGHREPDKHRHASRKHERRPVYAKVIESGEIVRVDAPITPFVPGRTRHPRTGPPTPPPETRKRRSIKDIPVIESKPKRTFAQRFRLRWRGMPIRPLSAYRGRHHFPQRHGHGHQSRSYHHGQNSSSSWKFWKSSPASHHSGWKGWFGKKRR